MAMRAIDKYYPEAGRLLDSGVTAGEIASKFGLVMDGAVLWLPGLFVCDTAGGETVYYADQEVERRAAEKYVNEGNYPSENRTYWVRLRVWRVGYEPEDGSWKEFDDSVYITVARHPDTPSCVEGRHKWRSPLSVVGGIAENPGCWGHGPGVIIRQVCSKCGIYRTMDTWAMNPATGEQGLVSTCYEPADERSLAWLREFRVDQAD